MEMLKDSSIPGLSFILMDDPEHARLRRMVTAHVRDPADGGDAAGGAEDRGRPDRRDARRAEAGGPGRGVRAAGALAGDLRAARRALQRPRLLPAQQQAIINRDLHHPSSGSAAPDRAGRLPGRAWSARSSPSPATTCSPALAERIKAGELARQEAAAMGVLMLFAGHETTANMIALGTLALLEHPDQLAALRDTDDPTLAASGGRGTAALPDHHPRRAAAGRAGGHRDRRPDHPRRARA